MYYTSKYLYMSLLYKHRKLPITELKWDARTVTDIPGNTAYWFFVFLWHTEGSRNNFGLQDSLTYMYYTSKCLYLSLLYKYIQ
jgi:hypothetical protein